MVTLKAFIFQVLSDDGSCKHAVAGVLADRLVDGKAANTVNTEPYCKARKRLPSKQLTEAAIPGNVVSWLIYAQTIKPFALSLSKHEWLDSVGIFNPFTLRQAQGERIKNSVGCGISRYNQNLARIIESGRINGYRAAKTKEPTTGG